MAAVLWFSARPVETEFDWMHDFDAAVTKARDKGVPLLVDFYADWCGPCRALDAEVFASKEVAAAARGRFVPVRVDLTDQSPNTPQAEVALRYGVMGIPQVFVIDPITQSVVARASPRDLTVQGMIAFLDRHSDSSRER